MSVLINLLPDIRLQRQREKERSRLIIGVALLVNLICVTLVGALFLIVSGQKILIHNATQSIASTRAQIEQIPDVYNALTAEQHLASLSSLYAQRLAITRLLDAYTTSTPTDVTISAFTLDNSGMLRITGIAGSYASVARLAIVLQDEKNKLIDGSTAASPLFTHVSIDSSARSQSSVAFTITTIVSLGNINGN